MSKSLKNFITIKVCQMSVQSRENSLLVLSLKMTRRKRKERKKTESKNFRLSVQVNLISVQPRRSAFPGQNSNNHDP